MKKLTVILILSAVVILSGCGSESVSEASQTEKTDKAAKAETSGTVLSDKGVELIYEDDKIYWTYEGEKSLIYSKNFVSDFGGIPDLKNIKGNSSLNNKNDKYQAFCYDKKNTIYFANPKDNQYICSYDGKDTRRIVEIPAFSLNYYGGSIYFLSIGAEIDPCLDPKNIFLEGYLYEYNLESGELKQLSEDISMRYLYVSSEGIFYIKNKNVDGVLYPYVYNFDKNTGESKQLYMSNCIINIDEYYLAYNAAENNTDYYWTNNAAEYHIKLNGIPSCQCAAEGKYYYQPQFILSTLCAFDLTTGEYHEMVYSESGAIRDYTVFNGEIYVSAGPRGSLFKWNNNEFEDLNIDNMFFEYLYSGPDAVYALLSTSLGYDFMEIRVTGEGVTVKSIAS